MDNKDLEKRIIELERELAMYRKVFKIMPTQVLINGTVLVKGKFNADRVYTGRSGDFVELTT